MVIISEIRHFLPRLFLDVHGRVRGAAGTWNFTCFGRHFMLRRKRDLLKLFFEVMEVQCAVGYIGIAEAR